MGKRVAKVQRDLLKPRFDISAQVKKLGADSLLPMSRREKNAILRRIMQ